MNENVFHQVPYLRTSRQFPVDKPKLEIELNKSYIDIAGAVNLRTIGIFPKNNPAVTGESWYFTTSRQQTLRKIYPFGAIAAGTELDIPVLYNNFESFTKIYGTCITDVVDYRPLPYVDSAIVTDQIGLIVGTVGAPPILQIRIIVGATSPNVTSGVVVLEFLSSV